MTFSACPKEEFGSRRWDELVARFDEAWLWHRSDYLEATDFPVPRTDISFVVLDEAGHPVAIVPLRLSRYRAFRIIPIRLLASVGGPAAANDLGPKQKTAVFAFIRERMFELARRFGVMEIEMFAPPMAPALRGGRCPRINPLLPFGCTDSQSQTWVVDLRRSEDDIRRAYAGNTRVELKKFRRESFELRFASGAADLEIYCELDAASLRRGGAIPHTREHLQHVFDRFVDKGLARALFLIQGGEVVAANITVVYKAGAHYWFGASRHDKLGGANRVLLDEQILEARKLGAEFFEAGQAFPWAEGSKLYGISEFKRSFGSELYPYFQGSIITRRGRHAALQLLETLWHHS